MVQAAEGRLALLRASLVGERGSDLAGLVRLVGDCQAVVNMVTAVQTAAIARVAAIEDIELDDGTVVEQAHTLGFQRLDAPALVSDQLGVSDQAACRRVSDAVALTTRMPGLVEAMARGTVDLYRCSVVAAELEGADVEVCTEVVTHVVDRLGGVCGGRLASEPAGRLRQRVRRVLGSIDPDLLRMRSEQARVDRELRRQIDLPGVDTWIGTYPVDQSRPAWAAIDALAQQYRREGRCSSIGQARADAHMDLLLQNVTGTYHLQVAVPMEQLLGDPTPAAPGEPVVAVTGLATGTPTHLRRAWLSELTGLATSAATTPESADPVPAMSSSTAVQPPVVTWSVVGCDSVTGTRLTDSLDPAGRRGSATETAAYVPTAALRELVLARDGRCRFPGCQVSARFCDLDHVRPWPTGPTAAKNLICLCRRHHRVKQTARWFVTLSPDGVVTWRDPAGRTRTTEPVDHLGVDTSRLPAHGRTLEGRDVQPSRAASATPCNQPDDEWSLLQDVLEHAIADAEHRAATLAPRSAGILGHHHEPTRPGHIRHGRKLVDVHCPRHEVLVTGFDAPVRRSVLHDEAPPPF